LSFWKGDMRLIIWLFGISMLFPFSKAAATTGKKSWTWLYKKRFSRRQMLDSKRQQVLRFGKYSIPHFSQLIFSWNAFRPRSGHFSFFARVRDARTKKWSNWYKMAEWGASVQRSYAGTPRKRTKYLYVRLETGAYNLADAFSIKIVPSKGASLARIRGFSVCTSNFNKFRPEKFSRELQKLPSVYVKNVPKKSQMVLDHPRCMHMCSPTSWSMLTSFLSGKDVSPLNFAKHVFDDGLDTYGTWHFNVAHAFERCGGRISFSTLRMNSFKTLHRQLMRGIPVLVSVRGFLQGAPKVYDNGHVMMVIGWNSKKGQVVCHDPAFPSNRKVIKRYDIRNFLFAWERSRRLAYLAEPCVNG
jgi:hypothetical protein